MTLLSNRRGVLSRAVFRLPLVLYGVGLGWIFGHQFLVLTHAGRRSGNVHETVLKVLHYDLASKESIVASAWGEQTDWYQNIRAHPAIAVRTGNEWYVPRQRPLPIDEAFAVLEDWTRRQRWFAHLMLGQIGQGPDLSESQLRAFSASVPFVGFRPRRPPAPPRRGQQADLEGGL